MPGTNGYGRRHESDTLLGQEPVAGLDVFDLEAKMAPTAVVGLLILAQLQPPRFQKLKELDNPVVVG